MLLRATRQSPHSWPRRLGLPLDFLPFAAAAYSTRLLRSNYTDGAIRVRRSTDNSELDIGFNANGDLDTVQLLAFCGAGSGFVATWYDQSLFARHASQGDPANQPRIVNSGALSLYSTVPMLEFYTNPPNVFINIGGSFDVGSFSAVFDNRSSTTFPNWESIFFNSSPRRPILYGVNAASTIGSDFPAAIWINGGQGVANPLFLTPPPGDTPRIVHASLTSTLTSNRALRIGRSDNNWNGRFGEFIIFPRKLSLDSRQDLDRNHGAYYGIAVA